MGRTVAIVFAADFSAQLERVSFHTPVWLADTPENRAAAEIAWQRAVEWPHITVTLFRSAHEPDRDDWHVLLHQISMQERSVDAIEVFGAPLTEAACRALTEATFARFEETATGFRARK
jgi:hypothetical protein